MQPDVTLPRTKAIKTYTALLTQVGTAAPVVTELKNDIGEIVWTRSDVGIYNGTLVGAFPEGKTTLMINNTTEWDTANNYLIRSSADLVYIRSTDSNLASDGWLAGTTIEIRVYDI